MNTAEREALQLEIAKELAQEYEFNEEELAYYLLGWVREKDLELIRDENRKGTLKSEDDEE